MDLLVWGETNGVPAAEVAAQTGLGVDSVEAAYWEIARRREATAYLHAPAVVLHAEGAGG